MSRLAPTILVDRSTRRVLVDDLVSRVPRCDCCPDVTDICQSCDAPTLGAMQFESLLFRGRSDWRVVRSDASISGCSDSPTRFSEGPFGGDTPMIRHPGPFSFIAGDLPGGGTGEARWFWNPFLLLESPTLAFPDNLIIFALWVDTVLFTDGRVAYVVGLYFQARNDANLFDPPILLFFEDGALPANASPCVPDVFPLPISLRQEGFALELQAGGFV